MGLEISRKRELNVVLGSELGILCCNGIGRISMASRATTYPANNAESEGDSVFCWRYTPIIGATFGALHGEMRS